MQYSRTLVILNGLVPLAILLWDAWRGQLGANAVNHALHITGILSLVFLFLSLMVTPIRILTGWNAVIAYRRALGLFGFAYGVVHLMIYFLWDRMASVGSTFSEIAQRRFLTVGFVALLLMVPLAVTSTNNMIRRMGAARWKRLHRLAYVATVLGVLHYIMLVKSDLRQPVAFATALTPILGFRAVRHYNDRRRQRGITVAPTPTARQAPARGKIFQGELKIAQIHRETHDVKTYRLVATDAQEIPFRFLPGQYLTLDLNLDGQRVRRSYTLASSPAQRSYVELTIKRDPLGRVSRYLHDQVQTGQAIRVIAPGGRFTFSGTEHASVLLIAGGVGITPTISMLRYLTDTVWQGNLFFVNAIRSLEDFVFEQELRELVRRFANLRVMTFVSQAATLREEINDLSRWQIRRGRIDFAALHSWGPDCLAAPVYLCGPEPMMQATRTTLEQLGVPADRVFTEEFISPALPSPVPVDALETTIVSDATEIPLSPAAEIQFTRSGKQVPAASDSTILEIAESAGIPLSWECRAGICGQCKVRCTHGRVRMDSADAITSAEQQAGWILACQARPQTNTIHVDA